MKITLRQLEVFCAITRHKQVTKASSEVAMTQAAASMALGDLEHQLGCALFDRVGRQLVLNDSGRMLASRAREVLDRVAEIEHLAKGQQPVFDLRVGASTTTGNHLLPGLIASVKKNWPRARLHVSRMTSREVIAGLKSHQIDLGFIEGALNDEAIRRFFWKDDQLRLFVAPDHPLAKRVISPADLLDAEWIVREEGSGTREIMTQACTKAGIAPRIGFELEQPEAIRQCVKAGLGIGCLSGLEVNDALHAGTLVGLDTPFLDMSSQHGVAILKDRYLGAGPRAMLELCGVKIDM